MRAFSGSILCSLAFAVGAVAQDSLQLTDRPQGVTYTLLDGSYLVDDCQICGRPTIMQPLRGTFDLVLVDYDPFVSRYEVRNVEFAARDGWVGPVRLTGNGSYARYGDFALMQEMDLALRVCNSITNLTACFSSGADVVQKPLPLIQINLTQTNGTVLQTFELNLVAAPLREVWFSTAKSFTAVVPDGEIRISAGDLISNLGRVVKHNGELVARLGVMPIVPDLGLDAVQITRRGLILYSIPVDVWSETMGQIQHGDLLSNRGEIVRRNQDLLKAFSVAEDQPDAGLDAVQMMPDGSVLFSVQKVVELGDGTKLDHGDILSDQGNVYRTNKELLAKFNVADRERDYGLDALHILPGGEIWFSVSEGFVDEQLGSVLAGDLLSDLGRRVFSQRQLLAAFDPVDPSQDYGLDALFVVTDMKPRTLPPRILKLRRLLNSICVDWEGDGDVFQLEHATSLSGPWTPCSPILPALTFEDACDAASGDSVFYRIRQW